MGCEAEANEHFVERIDQLAETPSVPFDDVIPAKVILYVFGVCQKCSNDTSPRCAKSIDGSSQSGV